MSDEEECGHSLKTKDGFCDNKATKEDGRCGYHSETTEGNMSGWERTYKHGIYKNRGGYYESLPERDQKFIDAIADDLIDKSYFTRDDPAAVEKLRQIAVDIHQKRRADEQVADGLTQTKEVGYHEDYGIIEQEEEHTLMITKDRLSREARMTLKDFGVLDREHNKTKEAAESFIESLSKE